MGENFKVTAYFEKKKNFKKSYPCITLEKVGQALAKF